MRFGVFRYLRITRDQLSFVHHDRSWALKHTWAKYLTSSRTTTVRFPCEPISSSPANYHVPNYPRGGVQEISAGRVVLWYVRSMGPDYPSDNDLFPLLESFTDKRMEYQRWLQDTLSAALPHGSAIPTLIRPHSPRAGWVTDRARQETPTHTLMAEGNWGSVRAMSTYIRTNVH